MSGKWQSGEGPSFESYKYKKLFEDDYKLYLEPFTIRQYLQKLTTIQKRIKFYYFPSSRRKIKNYCLFILFYGIEHLAAFYLNLHLNFTYENPYLSRIRRSKIGVHGIDPSDFYKIPSELNLENFLNYKLKFGKFGLAPRFFLLLDFPTDYFFLKTKKIF